MSIDRHISKHPFETRSNDLPILYTIKIGANRAPRLGVRTTKEGRKINFGNYA